MKLHNSILNDTCTERRRRSRRSPWDVRAGRASRAGADVVVVGNAGERIEILGVTQLSSSRASFRGAQNR